MCTPSFEVEGQHVIAIALSIAETLQSVEHTFLAGGKVPAFVELLKFKVGDISSSWFQSTTAGQSLCCKSILI